MKMKDTIGPMTDDFGNVILDNGVNVELLNEYFASIFTKENLVDIPMFNKASYKNALNTVDFTEETVYDKLCKLKANKSPGVDGIYPVVPKILANVISKPLSHIFNQSLLYNIVPHDWKLANVTPLFKKGPKNKVSSYRPVSLTSHVCKIIEYILKDNINNHLEQNGLIRNSQNGFGAGRSCLTNLLRSMEIATKQVDKGLPVDVVYLDFSKAFDEVPHNCLINKIKTHGIGCFVANWIESWLRNRYQRVVLNGYMSDWLPVLSGVPQGSVLGLILFIAYINDFYVNLNRYVLKFADDANVFSEVSSLDKVVILQSDVDKLHKWFEDWQMMSNAQKCKCLHIAHKNTYATYSIGGVEVTNISCERDLGVVIDEF